MNNETKFIFYRAKGPGGPGRAWATDHPQRAFDYHTRRVRLEMKPAPLKDWLRAERGDPDLAYGSYRRVEERAHQIYLRRVQQGRRGDQLSDWLMAEMEIYDELVEAVIWVAFERHEEFDRGGFQGFLAEPNARRMVGDVADGRSLASSKANQPTTLLAFQGSAVGFGLVNMPDLDLSETLSLLFSAGGVKLLFDLLVAWLKERSSRVVRLKVGAVELEISGATNEQEILRLREVLEGLIELQAAAGSDPARAAGTAGNIENVAKSALVEESTTTGTLGKGKERGQSPGGTEI